MCMHKKHLSYMLMHHKKSAIFAKQQDDKNSDVPKNYPLHLMHICVNHIPILNCFYKEGFHKETSNSLEPYKYCNLKIN